MYFACPDGSLDYYDKCNLFVYSGEDKVYTAGKEAVVWEFRGARIRPVICYDIRFPVFLYNRNQYDIMLVSAAFPTLVVAKSRGKRSFLRDMGYVFLGFFWRQR